MTSTSELFERVVDRGIVETGLAVPPDARAYLVELLETHVRSQRVQRLDAYVSDVLAPAILSEGRSLPRLAGRELKAIADSMLFVMGVLPERVLVRAERGKSNWRGFSAAGQQAFGLALLHSRNPSRNLEYFANHFYDGARVLFRGAFVELPGRVRRMDEYTLIADTQFS